MNVDALPKKFHFLLAVVALMALAGCTTVPNGGGSQVDALYQIARALDWLATVIFLGCIFGGFSK